MPGRGWASPLLDLLGMLTVGAATEIPTRKCGPDRYTPLAGTPFPTRVQDDAPASRKAPGHRHGEAAHWLLLLLGGSPGWSLRAARLSLEAGGIESVPSRPPTNPRVARQGACLTWRASPASLSTHAEGRATACDCNTSCPVDARDFGLQKATHIGVFARGHVGNRKVTRSTNGEPLQHTRRNQ
jgi:hypothetical protein